MVLVNHVCANVCQSTGREENSAEKEEQFILAALVDKGENF
jgi:hypothetical protein